MPELLSFLLVSQVAPMSREEFLTRFDPLLISHLDERTSDEQELFYCLYYFPHSINFQTCSKIYLDKSNTLLLSHTELM